jgi:hypothetical protein
VAFKNNNYYLVLFRRLLHPSAYQNPEFDFCGTHDNACRPLDEILTGEKTLSGKDAPPRSYDYRDPELPETNSSLVTIFAIWNTTVGTSLLSMSWGIEKTGLFPAVLINILIAAICLYTTYTLLKVNEKHGVIGQAGEVCDLCKALIGQWAEILAKIFSLVVLIGANIVYWILMSNFFYNSVQFFYGNADATPDAFHSNTVFSRNRPEHGRCPRLKRHGGVSQKRNRQSHPCGHVWVHF